MNVKILKISANYENLTSFNMTHLFQQLPLFISSGELIIIVIFCKQELIITRGVVTYSLVDDRRGGLLAEHLQALDVWGLHRPVETCATV